MAWDVIVVGAGPAGSTAARHLARAGYRVLLLERAELPRYKPCAGALAAAARPYLELAPQQLASAVEDSFRRVEITLCGREPLHLELEEPIADLVDRSRLDLLLAEEASRAGAILRPGCPAYSTEVDSGGVTVQTAAGPERAAVVVGADGATGVVARSLGLVGRRPPAAALEAELPVPPEVLERFRHRVRVDYGSLPHGYGWIFPKREHLSVGMGSFRPPCPGLPGHLRAFLRAAGVPWTEPLPLRGHPIPHVGMAVPPAAYRALLVGDAAGLADPFSGEGIRQAVLSGRIAAQEIAAALGGAARADLSFRCYARRIKKEVRRDLELALRLADLFYRYPRGAHRLLAASPELLALCFATVQGRARYRHLPLAALRALLRLLLSPQQPSPSLK
ncbi:MAG: geranylgeranyl reductase family protein [Bacillota bacterium]|nr:geranylgeranyl reductase family protein [Bacillota bacterium]